LCEKQKDLRAKELDIELELSKQQRNLELTQAETLVQKAAKEDEIRIAQAEKKPKKLRFCVRRGTAY